MDDVQVGFIRAHGDRVISEEDLVQLRSDFELVLLPMARSLGLLSAELDFTTLAAQYDGRAGIAAQATAREVATDSLRTAAGWISIAAQYCSGDQDLQDQDDEDDPIEWREIAGPGASLTAHTFGYLSALIDTRNDIVRRGANGRRLLGATTRENIRKGAMKYRGRMSKDDAAVQMSNVHGKSAGHIRKLLSKLYPGDTWDEQDTGTSTDAAGQNDG